MGVSDVNPLKEVGIDIPPREWNRFILIENTLLIDTRNDYECVVGTFIGALNPKIKTFRELPRWIREHSIDLKKKRRLLCSVLVASAAKNQRPICVLWDLITCTTLREEFSNILKKSLGIKVVGKENALFSMNEYLSVMDISKVQF